MAGGSMAGGSKAGASKAGGVRRLEGRSRKRTSTPQVDLKPAHAPHTPPASTQYVMYFFQFTPLRAPARCFVRSPRTSCSTQSKRHTLNATLST
eukprot:366273-Chlamydomonas_euryale.AAC.13